MSLKKILISQNQKFSRKYCVGQTIIEYMALLAVFALGIIVVFGGFNPERLTPQDVSHHGRGLTEVLRTDVNSTVNYIAGWK